MSTSSIADTSRLKAKPFVQSAYEMAMTNEPVVGFSADGTTLEIRDVPLLCDEVLPRYFKHKNISSFFRQLNMYGFEKVSFDGAAHAFRHDFFRKDRPDLLDQVSRSNSTRKPNKPRRLPLSASSSTSSSNTADNNEGDQASSAVDRIPTSMTQIPASGGLTTGNTMSNTPKIRDQRRIPPSDALQTKLKPFVYAAFEMVTNNEGPYVGFSADGTALEIRDVTLFSEKVLPKYFKHKNISSFIRQLNMYGFEKIDGAASKEGSMPVPHTFYHEYFRRGREDWLPLILRKTKAKRGLNGDEESSPKRGRGEEEDDEADYSSGSQRNNTSVSAFSSMRKVHRFIESAYAMAVNGHHPEVGMSADGSTLEIRDILAFTKQILPLYFSHKDYSAFTRQLSMYGFDQVGEGRFRHPYFLRDREDLLEKVVPVHATSSQSSTGAPSSATMNPARDPYGLMSSAPSSMAQLSAASNSIFGNLPKLSLLGPHQQQGFGASGLGGASGMDFSGNFQPVPSHPLSVLSAAQKLSLPLSALGPFHPSSTTAAGGFPSPTGNSSPLSEPGTNVSRQSQNTTGNPTALMAAAVAAAGMFGLQNSIGPLPSVLNLNPQGTQQQSSNGDLRSQPQPPSTSLLNLRQGNPSSSKSKQLDEAQKPVEGNHSDEQVDDEDDDEEEDIDDSDQGKLDSDDEAVDDSDNEDVDEDDEGGAKTGRKHSGSSSSLSGGKPKSTPFVHAAYEIAMLDNPIVGFNAAGNALEIRDETLLSNEILPKYFKHNNVSSFVRQLNMYGFEKIVGSLRAAHTFQHENFRRNRPDLLGLINRKQNKVASQKRKVEQETKKQKKTEQLLRRELTAAAAAAAALTSSGSSMLAAAAAIRNKPTPFVHATYELAMLNNEAIGFSSSGNALEIRNEALLAELYLPKYFKHKNVSSFIRQLNMYGFEKTESAPGVVHTFQHECFEQNREDLLPVICRKHVKLERKSAGVGSSTGDEDDTGEVASTIPGGSEPQVSNVIPPVRAAVDRQQADRTSETLDAVTGLTMLRSNSVSSEYQQQQQQQMAAAAAAQQQQSRSMNTVPASLPSSTSFQQQQQQAAAQLQQRFGWLSAAASAQHQNAATSGPSRLNAFSGSNVTNNVSANDSNNGASPFPQTLRSLSSLLGASDTTPTQFNAASFPATTAGLAGLSQRLQQGLQSSVSGGVSNNAGVPTFPFPSPSSGNASLSLNPFGGVSLTAPSGGATVEANRSSGVTSGTDFASMFSRSNFPPPKFFNENSATSAATQASVGRLNQFSMEGASAMQSLLNSAVAAAALQATSGGASSQGMLSPTSATAHQLILSMGGSSSNGDNGSASASSSSSAFASSSADASITSPQSTAASAGVTTCTSEAAAEETVAKIATVTSISSQEPTPQQIKIE